MLNNIVGCTIYYMEGKTKKKAEYGGKNLKTTLWNGEARTRFLWLRIGAVGRLWMQYWTFGCHKIKGISWQVEDSLACQKESVLWSQGVIPYEDIPVHLYSLPECLTVWNCLHIVVTELLILWWAVVRLVEIANIKFHLSILLRKVRLLERCPYVRTSRTNHPPNIVIWRALKV